MVGRAFTMLRRITITSRTELRITEQHGVQQHKFQQLLEDALPGLGFVIIGGHNVQFLRAALFIQ